MKKIILLLLVFSGFSLSLTAQKVISEKVTDEDLPPLNGVSVVLKRTGTGTLTDADCKISLTVTCEGDIVEQ